MKKVSLKFFVWAAIMVAFILAILMLMLNVYFVLDYHHNTSSHIHGTFWAYMALLAVTSILNIITVAASIKYAAANSDITTFPIPRMLCADCCKDRRRTTETEPLRHSDGDVRRTTGSDDDDNGDDIVLRHRGCVGSGRYCRVSLLWLAGYSVSLFVILASYHSVYIILGSVASPVMALSHVTFYITATASLVAFLALFLRGIEESKCNEEHGTRQLAKTVFNYTPPIFAVLLFILCVLGFGLFYFLFSIMVQDYRHGGSYLSIVGMFLPSLLLGFTGYSGKKLIDCLARQDEQVNTEETLV